MTGPSRTEQAEISLNSPEIVPEEVEGNLEGTNESSLGAPVSVADAEGNEVSDSEDNSGENKEAKRRSGCNAFVALINGKFDFRVQPPDCGGAVIIANNSHCALFIEDKETAKLLDEFQERVREGTDDSSEDSPLFSTGQIQTLQEPLLSHLKNKATDNKVFLTEKSRDSAGITTTAVKYVQTIAYKMKFTDEERRFVHAAGTAYFNIKYRRFESSPLNQNSAADPSILESLTIEPRIQQSLSHLYATLVAERSCFKTLPSRVATIITAVDLLMDNLDLSRPIPIERADTVRAEVGNLASRLLYSDVVEAVLQLIDDEIEKNGGTTEFNRVLIYSDQVKGLYALQSRLRSDDFVITTTGTPEEFAREHKRHLPNMVILHFSSGPTAVIKALNQFLNKGLSIGSVPAFVLAKDTVVGRLTPLLDMGIEEILDLESQLDILVHKMKKTKITLRDAYESRRAKLSARSISQGDLAHMSIIDLLQALGPGRRTSCITVSRPDAAEALVLYLDKGKITTAELGPIVAEKAIYEAMKWERGSWKVEPVEEGDLPDPNVTDSNEAILMEGCRLMDEQSKSSTE